MNEIPEETTTAPNKTQKITTKDILRAVDKFTDKTPKQQITFWWSFYKPIISSVLAALLPALIVGGIMRWQGGYTNWEIVVVTVLVFISVRVNNVYNLLRSNINPKKEDTAKKTLLETINSI